MRILIIISSKYPNSFLYDCIVNLYKNQIDDEDEYKICIIDSNSNNTLYYDKIKIDYPEIDIHFSKNPNYEFGAYKYGYEYYLDYDIYYCIQDSIIIKNKINLNKIDDNTSYIIYHNSGYNYHLHYKHYSIEQLKLDNLYDINLVDTNFTLAQHNVFIVTNNVMKDIFTVFKYLPINKNDSCMYERHFGIYFIKKNIKTIDIGKYIEKYNGGRN